MYCQLAFLFWCFFCWGPFLRRLVFTVPLGAQMQDLLHTLHQGVACCAIAGVVIAHILLIDPGCTLDGLDRHLLRAYMHYRAWCRSHGLSGSCVRFNKTRFNKEKWSMYPELSTQYKASTVKYMQYWVHAFLMSRRTDNDEDLIYMTYSLAMFQYMLDTQGPWMSEEKRLETKGFGCNFLLFYQRLAGSHRGHKRNFKIVPKFHFFCHMMDYIGQTGRNPRPLRLTEGSVFLRAPNSKIKVFIFNPWSGSKLCSTYKV